MADANSAERAVCRSHNWHLHIQPQQVFKRLRRFAYRFYAQRTGDFGSMRFSHKEHAWITRYSPRARSQRIRMHQRVVGRSRNPLESY